MTTKVDVPAPGEALAGSWEEAEAGASERPDGVPWWALLLAPLLCLPCVLAVAGGAAAVAAGGAAAGGALTDGLLVSLGLGGLVFAGGAGLAVVFLRRRTARACSTGECAPTRAARMSKPTR